MKRTAFDLYTSQIVLDEAGQGDATAAAARLAALADLPLLTAPSSALALAQTLERKLQLPARARADALHLAIAAVNGIQFLLTWNCKHLANGNLMDKIDESCEDHGFAAPHVLTPDQLMETP